MNTPVSVERKPTPDPEPLSSILEKFNKQFNFPGIEDESDIEYAHSSDISQVSADKKTEPEAGIDSKEEEDSVEVLTRNPSSFDLNAAEFPITHLSNRLPQGVSKTEIRYSDFIKGKDGVKVERNWTVLSNAKIDILDDNNTKIGEEVVGLGGPTALQVFFEILQVWKEQGFKSNKIFIGTHYNLLKRLNWPINGNSYRQLERDLHSLYGLEFNAVNAYYDLQQGRYVDKRMKLFEGWSLYKHSNSKSYDSDYGYIDATLAFWESMKNKTSFYLPFDKDYFKKLKPHEAKLSLVLAKLFNPYRKRVVSKWRKNIYEMCDILPIHATDKRKRKFNLIKAAEGLLEKEFNLLADFTIEGDDIIFINKQTIPRINELRPNEGSKTKEQIELLIDDQLSALGDKHSIHFYRLVAKYCPEELIYKCLSEAKAEGKDMKKYYTFQIKMQGREYLKRYRFWDKDSGDVVQGSLHL